MDRDKDLLDSGEVSGVFVGVCLPLPPLLPDELVCGDPCAPFPFDLVLFSDDVGDSCWLPTFGLLLGRGVSPALPLMASSLAAALRAEQRFPKTSGWGGGVEGAGVLVSDFGVDGWPEDLRVTLVDVSLPESHPVALEAACSFLDLRPRLLSLLFPSLSLWVSFSCFFRSERVRRFSAREESSESEDEEEGEFDRRLWILDFFSSLPSLVPPVLASPLFLFVVLLSPIFFDERVPVDETEDGEEERTESWLLCRLMALFFEYFPSSLLSVLLSSPLRLLVPSSGRSVFVLTSGATDSWTSGELSTRLRFDWGPRDGSSVSVSPSFWTSIKSVFAASFVSDVFLCVSSIAVCVTARAS